MHSDTERAFRVSRYKADTEFNRIMQQANHALLENEKQLLQTINIDESPAPVFICYPGRSGSTLLSQLLTRTQRFCYISNLVSRFWCAPYLASLLEKNIGADSLLKRFGHTLDLSSEHGNTNELFEPNEFGYFWSRFLPYSQHGNNISTSLAAHDRLLIQRTISAISLLHNKPMLVKNSLAGVNTRLIRTLFPNARFIISKRDVRYIVQSLYLYRLKRYGDVNFFAGLKPSNYQWIINNISEPFEQIAYQVKGIYADIEAGLVDCPSGTVTDVCYENLVQSPRREILRLLNFCGISAGHRDLELIGDTLQNGNQVQVSRAEFSSLQEHCERVFEL